MAHAQRGIGREFPIIQELIEKHYRIRLIDLDGGSELFELRGIVNSLKHSRGRPNKKGILNSGGNLGTLMKALERSDVDETKARKAITDVKRFLIALESAIERSATT
jgi:hypothetical protein